jgi:hypothetical protein
MTPDETDAPSSGAAKFQFALKNRKSGSRLSAAPADMTCGCGQQIRRFSPRELRLHCMERILFKIIYLFKQVRRISLTKS